MGIEGMDGMAKPASQGEKMTRIEEMKWSVMRELSRDLGIPLEGISYDNFLRVLGKQRETMDIIAQREQELRSS